MNIGKPVRIFETEEEDEEWAIPNPDDAPVREGEPEKEKEPEKVLLPVRRIR